MLLPAIRPLFPVTEDGSLFGESDFVDIIEYVAELQRRGTGISEALDAHARPHMAVPEAALEVRNNGTISLELDEQGSFIPFPEGSALPELYFSWDAKFEAHSAAMTDADLRVLRMSRISPVLVNQWERTGQLASGAALSAAWPFQPFSVSGLSGRSCPWLLRMS